MLFILSTYRLHHYFNPYFDYIFIIFLTVKYSIIICISYIWIHLPVFYFLNVPCQSSYLTLYTSNFLHFILMFIYGLLGAERRPPKERRKLDRKSIIYVLFNSRIFYLIFVTKCFILLSRRSSSRIYFLSYINLLLLLLFIEWISYTFIID